MWLYDYTDLLVQVWLCSCMHGYVTIWLYRSTSTSMAMQLHAWLEQISNDWKTYGTDVPCRDHDDLGFRMNPCRDRAVPCAMVFHSHTKSALLNVVRSECESHVPTSNTAINTWHVKMQFITRQAAYGSVCPLVKLNNEIQDTKQFIL